MAENADTERVDEPEKEQETVNEEALKKGNEDDCNTEVVQALSDLKIDQETAKLENQEPLPVSAPTSVNSAQAPDEALRARIARYRNLQPECRQVLKLLSSLPVLSSVSEDLSLTIRFPYIRRGFGHRSANNQIFNPISVQRSFSDDTLQSVMVVYLLCISSFDNIESKVFVHECPGTMPFLIACLRSQIVETIQFAASAMSWLSSEDSNRKKMGELGAVGPLVDLLRQGDDYEVGLSHTVRAIFNLCTVAENREEVVSEGVVLVLMEKIMRRVCLIQVLRTLERLSRDEKGIAEIEEHGMFVLKVLFKMLSEGSEEGVTEESKEYCITIIHTVCGASVAKMRELINGANNGRETLEFKVGLNTNCVYLNIHSSFWSLKFLATLETDHFCKFGETET